MSGVEVSGVNGEDQWQKGWKAVTGSHTKPKKTYQDKMSAKLSAELSTTVDSHECDFLHLGLFLSPAFTESLKTSKYNCQN